MNLKKIVALALAVLMVVGLSFSALAETMELTFWTLQGRSDAYDVLTAEFNAAHDDVNVTVSYFDTDGIKDACKVAGLCGTGCMVPCRKCKKSMCNDVCPDNRTNKRPKPLLRRPVIHALLRLSTSLPGDARFT